MQPSDLKASDFGGYPPQGRQFAIARLALLRELPQALVPSLLAQIIVYDWMFPAERNDLDNHFDYLSGLSGENLRQATLGFTRLTVSPRLQGIDWVQSPKQYLEAFSAELWTSSQIDMFTAAADELELRVNASAPKAAPAIRRFCMIAMGTDVDRNSVPLFRKLRPHGTYFDNLVYEDGLQDLLNALSSRANRSRVPYAHWYIDGGKRVAAATPDTVVSICYGNLEGPRKALLRKMNDTINSGSKGPEALRTMLAQLTPRDVDLGTPNDDATLTRFQLNVLTEGSGTQVFSTTFTQWAAREALRRAQPVTLLLRFASRQEQRTLNELLDPEHGDGRPDIPGSLIDADMGSYYTWINQQRLSGAESSSLLVWFENHKEALAIGPSIPVNAQSSRSISLRELVALLDVAKS